jgi:colicin import membrane protein
MWTLRSPELGLALALATGGALAQGLEAQVERDRIARERAGVEAQAAAARAACAARFAATACVEGVDAERRERLRALDRQRALLDEAQRKARAVEREERLAERRRLEETRPAAPPVASGPATPAVRPVELPVERAGAAGAERAEAREKAASAAEAQAAQRAQAARRREVEIETHRAAVEQRDAASPRKPGVALPASAPR